MTDNALLRRSLEPGDIKPRLPGIRLHLPPDANTLPAVAELRIRVVNVVDLMRLQPESDARARHRERIVEHGEDLPEIRDWRWAS